DGGRQLADSGLLGDYDRDPLLERAMMVLRGRARGHERIDHGIDAERKRADRMGLGIVWREPAGEVAAAHVADQLEHLLDGAVQLGSDSPSLFGRRILR